MNTVDAVIALDLLDTVVEDPFFSEVPRLLGATTMEQVTALLEPGVWIAFETGAIDEAEYLRRMFRQGVAPPATPAQVRQAILRGYRFLPGLEPLLVDLARAGAPIWALSNYSPWIDELRRRLGLDRFFAGYVVSCRTGLRKPDPRAYSALLSHCGVDAGRCLFVDDRATNVEGARAVGLQALRFEGADALRAELVRRGLL